MKKFFCFICLTCLTLPAVAQDVLSLDSCRALAIANNKELLIGQEKIKAAHYRKKAAFTSYLPQISATGGYMRNQKEFSLLNDAQKGALGSVGTQVSGALQNGIQGMITQYPQLTQNPQFMALVQSLGNIDIATPLNGLGQSLVDAFRTDTRNMYAGALTLTQPLYMGGKIRAYNKITRYAEELARQQHNSGMQEVILSTDQAYWQVVSLANKKKLAEGYLELLQKLESDVDKMIAEGVATKADGLSVKVKVNEAEMTLTKVDDGLSLSRMLLCQLCGLDLSTPIALADEKEDDLTLIPADNSSIDINNVYATRPEVRSLELATQIYKQKVNVTRSEFLPSVALIGNYMATRITQYQLDDAKEKIELQVSQSVFKVNEAAKKLIMAEKNLEKADENLRYATLGFEEGVIPASNVLEAHTAWLSAQSEKIDAQIDVKLTDIYLKKVTGSLRVENYKSEIIK